MTSIWTYLLLILGFVMLIKGADFLVDGSCAVAKALHVPTLIVGLTIVAFGTSCPEAAVSITASLNNANAMAFSNVIGSNIFNLLMVVGVSSIVTPVVVDRGLLKREFPMSIGVAALVCFFTFTALTSGGTAEVSQMEGIILLVLFVAFVVYMVLSALKKRNQEPEVIVHEKKRPMALNIVFIVVGLAAIVWGGDLVVNSASAIAKAFGMSDTLVGLTIVALGTSLPELVTSIVAARKGESDLALGNAVGSNIFNILMVLGAAAAISPVTVQAASVIDTLVLIVTSIIVWGLATTKRKIGRMEGLLMVGIYIGYMVYIIARDGGIA